MGHHAGSALVRASIPILTSLWINDDGGMVFALRGTRYI